jgi:Xaa-Pro aminopeptidase
MSTAERAERLRELLDDAGCDALLVTNLTNVRYLTGFSGSAAMLAVLPDELLLVTDGRYGDQAQDEVERSGVRATVRVGRTSDEQRDQLVGMLKGIQWLGVEADHITWDQQQSFESDWFPAATLVPTKGLVAELRTVKDEGEVARIEAACSMADAALAAARPRLGDVPTEAEIALELEWQMRRLGADGTSFETIVASGPNGARPHHRASQRRIKAGDLVVIDFGALLEGYHSDMTRTLAVGEVSETQERMWEVVREAQAAGVAAVAAGVEAREVDEASRAVIRDAGWEEAFVHGTGHGVGLDIHEGPRVAATSDARLTAGNVVTVEPGVYLPEHGGVRIEDTILVTSEGSRTLSRAPKDRSL